MKISKGCFWQFYLNHNFLGLITNFSPSQLQRLTWWTRHSEEPRLDIDDWLASQSTGTNDDNTSDAASTEKEKGVEMENLAKRNGKGRILSDW